MATAIFAGAKGNDFRKSTDLGLTWGGEDNTGTEEVYGIHGLSLSDIWASCAVGVVHHWNGTSWDARTDTGSGLTMYGIHMVATDNVWAVGAGGGLGSIYTYNGSTWSAHSEPAGTNNYYGVWASDASNVWVVGALVSGGANYGRIWKWNGASWSTQLSLGTSGENFTSVWGTDASNIWAGGGSLLQSIFYRYNGSSWSDIRGTLDTPDIDIEDISGYATDAVWICGREISVYNGSVQKWDGATWTTEYQQVSKNLNAIWISDGGDVGVVVGESGNLAIWTP